MLAPDPRLAEYDAMDGLEFEVAMAKLFEERLGFDSVERTERYDLGADLVVTMNGVRTAVQAKRRKRAVPIEAVRQVLDGITRYDCTKGLVVTNSYFTKPAVECAERYGIVLWDRPTLGGFLGGEPPAIDRSVCAECGVHVTSGVTTWCLERPEQYLGNVYCRKHQGSRNRRG